MMIKPHIASLIFAFLVLSCQNGNKTPNKHGETFNHVKEAPPVKAENSSKYKKEISAKSQKLYTDGDYVPFDKLQQQKLNVIEEPAKINLAKVTTHQMNGPELYSYLKARTLFIGSAFFSDKSHRMLLAGASGVVIQEDGVIITNYHVLEGSGKLDFKGMFVADNLGNVYPVTKVLSASQSNDLAILKVDTKGKKLKVLPLANQEQVGQTIYTMGHPYQKTFFMTKGIISRKYISSRNSALRVSITADFGRGSSGGPIVNTKGELVAMVSATAAYYTGGKRKGDLQMIFHEAIPVSTVHKFIVKDKNTAK